MKQTQKSLLGAAVLFAVLIAVGSAALWVKKDDLDKEEAKEKEAKPFSFDKEKATLLRLEKAGQLLAEASREGSGKPWRIVRPVQTDADQQAVTALIDRLSELKQRKDLGASVEGKQAGLEPPRLRLTVQTEDKKEHGLELGAENPFDASLFFRRTGEKATGTTDAAQFANFDKSLFDLRDKRVARLADDAVVTGFTVGNEEPYTLTRQGAAWKLTGPGHETFEAADQANADRILGSIRNLRAVGVAAEVADAAALKKFGLDESAKAVIELTLAAEGAGAPKRRIVTIGQPKPEAGQIAVKAYARRDDAGTIFEIEPGLLKNLEQTWFALQDKAVLKFDREEVRSLEIAAPDAGRIVVSRSKEAGKDGGAAEEKFAVVEPRAGVAKAFKISGTLLGLAGLKAAAFVEDAKAAAAYGLDKPRTYTLRGGGEKVLARLKLGSAVPGNGQRVYAQSEAGPVVEVDKTAIDDLAKTPGDVLEPAQPTQ